MEVTSVLLVEDNPGDARLIREALAGDGSRPFRVEHVERLEEGCARVAAGPYDAILLDLSLPDSHGLDTVRTVRKAAGLTPIVVLTSLGDEAVAAQAIREGAQDYLVKGEDFGVVARAVRYAIERQRLQTRLRDAHRLEAIGQMAAGVAHQFNSLMCGVLGHAELLREGHPTPAERAEWLEEIVRAATRATQLTDLLLSVGRQRRLQLESVDLNAALGQMAPMLRNMAGPGIRIAFELGRVSPIMFDVVQLEHVVTTLTMFARDAMPGGGQLTFESGEARLPDRDDALFARLTVTDTRAGSDLDRLARHFEPFHNLRELAEKHRTGLELPSILGVLTQAGGHIEPAAVGAVGSQLHVYFPTRAPASRETASP